MRERFIMPATMACAVLLLGGCMGARWSWKVDDGAVYEANRELLVVENYDHFFGLLWFESESLGLLLKNEDTMLEYYNVKGSLPAGTKIREAKQVGMWGFSFWWHFGSQTHTATYGEVLGGDFKGKLVNLMDYRQQCPRHGWWHLCPLDCPSRALKCLTPEKYDKVHVRSDVGIRN